MSVAATSKPGVPLEGVWHPTQRGLTVGLVATMTLFASESLAVSTIMPDIAKDLGQTGYGAAFSLFFLGSIVGVLVGGPAADRLGLRVPFLAVCGFFALGLVIAGLTPSMWLLILGRLFQGFGAGASSPIIYAAIGGAYSTQGQVRMFAVTSTAWVIPGVVGPGIAGIVSDAFGWRWVFLGLLPLVALAAALTVPRLTSLTNDAQTLPFSTLDIARFTAGAGLLLTGLSSSNVGAGVALAVTGLALCASCASRIFTPGLFRFRRGMAATVGLRGMLTAAFIPVDAFVPLVVTEVRGQSVLVASLAVTVATVCWTIGAWVAARVQERRGAPWLARSGFLLLATGITIELLILVPSVPLAIGIFGGAVGGIGMGLAFAPMSSVVLMLAPEGQQGTASSSLTLLDGLGFAFGAAATGALVTLGSHLSWRTATPFFVAWPLAALLALAGAMLASRMHAADELTATS